MKISNLRRETRKDNKVYLVADVACDFCTIKELWFSVDDKYSDWLTDDVYDSFLVAAIWPCMCYHEGFLASCSTLVRNESLGFVH